MLRGEEEDDYHAHNSYLEIYGTHGIISLFRIAHLFIWIGVNNYTFAVAPLVYSLTQTGLFWNISYMDIVVLAVLFLSSTRATRKSADVRRHKHLKRMPANR